MRVYAVLSIAMVCLATFTAASAAALSPSEVKKRQQSVAFEYRESLKVCDTLRWHAYETCRVTAETQRAINLAELKASSHPTAKSRLDARMAHVHGNYSVAISTCNGILREERQACWAAAESTKASETQEAKRFWGGLAE
ncbi:hypothetical protein Q9292_08685 [Methylophilus sp. VKM B-3414]|uniref:hypothetical protein n=1 Tax=Methylophilus sp. VKM B-3414 TaxID=3076121 RepID=UPI0028C8BE6D|nr:hypothetical protein [Methylophilus sp. VKM B-3414]MDT7849683.1 hypothetical protein [Methylophilus sp. VKM B-3414]